MRAILLGLTTLIFALLSHVAFAAESPSAHVQNMLASNAAASNSTQQIETTVHKYLMKKPEVVVEALQAYQQKQMNSMQDMFKETQKIAPKQADALFHSANDPVGGNVEGKVAMVEFSDYQCPHCVEIATVVADAIKSNPDLKVVVKEFPIRGPVSEKAARAALAANKQGKYWEFRNGLFKAGAVLTEEKITEVAKSVGLDIAQWKKDMDDAAIRSQVQANSKLAQDLKLMGTPAFFIAKSNVQPTAPADSINYIPGVLSMAQLQAIIDKISH